MALCVSSHVSVNFIQVSFFLSCSPAAQSNFCLPSSFSNFVSLHRTGKSISLMPQSFISLMPQSFSGLIYVGQQLSGKHKSFLCYQELKKKDIIIKRLGYDVCSRHVHLTVLQNRSLPAVQLMHLCSKDNTLCLIGAH